MVKKIFMACREDMQDYLDVVPHAACGFLYAGQNLCTAMSSSSNIQTHDLAVSLYSSEKRLLSYIKLQKSRFACFPTIVILCYTQRSSFNRFV